MLKDYLSFFAPQLRGHVELRAQISTSHAVAMLNGDLQSNARAQQGGVSARVYRNGVYGFASAVEYDEESVRRVLKAAEENALFLDARVKKNPRCRCCPAAWWRRIRNILRCRRRTTSSLYGRRMIT